MDSKVRFWVRIGGGVSHRALKIRWGPFYPVSPEARARVRVGGLGFRLKLCLHWPKDRTGGELWKSEFCQ